MSYGSIGDWGRERLRFIGNPHAADHTRVVDRLAKAWQVARVQPRVPAEDLAGIFSRAVASPQAPSIALVDTYKLQVRRDENGNVVERWFQYEAP